jgi:hypothetical protein
MKIAHKGLQVERIGDDDALEANIDSKSLPFLFEIMSNGLYSYPIPSIVREITSNCIDAHTEANVDEPVIIEQEFDYEDDVYYIKFIDKGIGMSAERIKKIYMNYFSSTKRDTNNLIGGFGLGSKTPLSYQDMFYIKTIHNNLEYDLIYHKGEANPQLESNFGWELVEEAIQERIYNQEKEEYELVEKMVKVKYPKGNYTTKSNGTEIKIEIKDGDISKFTNAIERQLCYFSNVYFQGFNVANEYKIYEGETFKFKNIVPFTEMHIVIDTVVYPIDFTKLNKKEILIPVGIKFHIGELEVTPNRESLRYTDEAIVLINKRIDACLVELQELYSKKSSNISDILLYIQARKQRPHILFGEEDKLHLPAGAGFVNRSNFKDIDDLYIPESPFFMYEVIGKLHENLITNFYDLTSIVEGSNCLYLLPNISSIKTSTNAFIYEEFGRDNYAIRRKTISYRKYKEIFNLDKYDKHGNKLPPVLGNALKISKYTNYIDNYIKQRSLNYTDVNPSDEWLEEYRERKKLESNAYRRKQEQKIIVRDLNSYRQEVKIGDLEKFRYVVYKLNDETKINLNELYHFVESRNTLRKILHKANYDKNIRPNNREILFIDVAKTNFKEIKHLTNLRHATEISSIPELRRLFRDSNAVLKIKDFLTKWQIDDIRNFNKISPYYASIYKRLKKFKDKHYTDTIRNNREGINFVCSLMKLTNIIVENDIKELEKVIHKFDVFRYFEYGTPERYLKQVSWNLKLLKLNENYYTTKTIENEQEQINDSEENRSESISND